MEKNDSIQLDFTCLKTDDDVCKVFKTQFETIFQKIMDDSQSYESYNIDNEFEIFQTSRESISMDINRLEKLCQVFGDECPEIYKEHAQKIFHFITRQVELGIERIRSMEIDKNYFDILPFSGQFISFILRTLKEGANDSEVFAEIKILYDSLTGTLSTEINKILVECKKDAKQGYYADALEIVNNINNEAELRTMRDHISLADDCMKTMMYIENLRQN